MTETNQLCFTVNLVCNHDSNNLSDNKVFFSIGGTKSGTCASGFGVCCVCESFTWVYLLVFPKSRKIRHNI